MEREPRIDIVRGIAIVTIFLNHLTQVVEFAGYRGWMIPTPTRLGFSTAAELFVIMSGYMVGLVYLRRPHPARAIVRRAGTLWLYDIALLAIVLPIGLVMTAGELAFWRLDVFWTAPAAATARFAMLQSAPRLLDILQLYISLMLLAPLAMALHARAPRAVIPLSVALWIASQAITWRAIAANPAANLGTGVSLAAWQMLFFVPMALGARSAHRALFGWLDGHRTALIALVTLAIAGAAVRQLQEAQWLARPWWLEAPLGLHPLRVAHAVLMLVFYAAVLTWLRPWLARQPWRALAAIGRHSLDCFTGGVVLTYALGTLWLGAGGGYPAYYVLALAGVAATVALAYARDARAARLRGTQAPSITAR